MASRIRTWIRLTIGLVFVWALNAPVSAARFVPGDVILTFVHQSESNAALLQARRSNPVDLRSLTMVVSRLQAHAHVPLKPKRILSGTQLLLSIDQANLTDQLVRTLRTRANVETVTVLKDQNRVASSSMVRVVFAPGSPESEILKQKPPEDAASALTRLLSDLEATLRVPLQTDAADHSTLELAIDLNKLTTIVIERLQSTRDVESAQPNYIMTIQ